MGDYLTKGMRCMRKGSRKESQFQQELQELQQQDLLQLQSYTQDVVLVDKESRLSEEMRKGKHEKAVWKEEYIGRDDEREEDESCIVGGR